MRMERPPQPFLRQPTRSDDAWASEVLEARGRAIADPRALGPLGDLLRVGNALTEARGVLGRAVEVAVMNGDEPRRRANIIRLATAEFYDGAHAEAIPRLAALVRDIEASSDRRYLDFALQHLGKALAEVGRYTEAVALFERALGLRKDPGLRASSREALAAARARIG